MKLRPICAFFFLSVIACTATNNKDQSIPMSSQEIEHAIRYLASDELMGRATGSPGIQQAGDFIIKQFEQFGIVPAPGSEHFRQHVDFELIDSPTSAQITVNNASYQQQNQMAFINGGAIDRQAEFIYIENLLESDNQDQLADKIIITPFGKPNADIMGSIYAMAEKRAIAAKHQALGIIEIYNQPIPWPRIRNYFTRTSMQLKPQTANEAKHMVLNPRDETKTWLKATGMGILHIQSNGMTVKKLRCANIAGYVEGTDPALKDEVIVLTAHYDHVGAGMDKRGATEADSIFNGARDNGMGVVALLAAAKSLAAQPAKRPVLFLALTAEENGLLGSKFYVSSPLIPLEKTAFVLNNDGAGAAEDSLVTVVGISRVTAKRAISRGAAKFDFTAIADPVPDQQLFSRSDNYPFAQKGIPAISFSPGFRVFDQRLMAKYHQPSDEIDDEFSFEYLQKFCYAYAEAARNIANMENKPYWNAGDPLEAEAEKLYEKN